MYWQETKENDHYIVPDDVVDVVYNIQCRCLPVDHVWALSRAISAALPWFADEPEAGLHPIHVAESGNGWMRPDAPDALLQLSRRTKLMLRLPKHRTEDAGKLTGQTLDVGGNTMKVEKATAEKDAVWHRAGYCHARPPHPHPQPDAGGPGGGGIGETPATGPGSGADAGLWAVSAA